MRIFQPKNEAELANDYGRAQKLWPASTAWLVVSIVFANKLWIMDATSMSLYWVARLPIERPKATSALAPRTPKPPRPERKRQRKIAFSLAIVGALAAPFVFRTYKARPTLPLPESFFHEEIYPCAYKDFYCNYQNQRRIDEATRIDLARYIPLNVGVAAATFVSIFGLAYLIPMSIRGVGFLVRRYWRWLNA